MSALKTYLFSILLVLSYSVSAQGNAWIMHTVEDFNFYYKEDRSLFIEILRQELKYELFRLQNDLNYHLNDNLDIVLVEDEQSRLDIQKRKYTLEANSGGLIEAHTDKVILNIYDSPDEIMADFKSQAVAVILHEMLYGGTLQDMIKSANLLYLPQWVIPGICKFMADDWTASSDNEWRLVYEKYGIRNFNRIPAEFEALKGASFWKFLSDRYGRNSIPTLLYIARLTRKFNAALYYAFHKTGAELFREWRTYYEEAYLHDQHKRMPVRGINLPEAGLYDIYVRNANTIYVILKKRAQYRLVQLDGEGNQKILHRFNSDIYPIHKFSGSLQVVNGILYCFMQDNDGLCYYRLEGENMISEPLGIKNIRKIYQYKNTIYLLSSSLLESCIYRLENEPVKIYSYEGCVSDFAISPSGIYCFFQEVGAESKLALIGDDGKKEIMKVNYTIRQLIASEDSLLFFNANKNGIYNGMVYNSASRTLDYLTDYRSHILFHQLRPGLFSEYVIHLEESILIVIQDVKYEDFYRYDSISPTYFLKRVKTKVSKITPDDYEIQNDSLPPYMFQSPVPPDADFTESNYDSLKKRADYLNQQNNGAYLSPEFYRPKLFYFQFYNQLSGTKDLPFNMGLSEYMPNHLGVRIGAAMQNQFNERQVNMRLLGFRIWPNRDIELGYQSYRARRPYSFDLLHRQRLDIISANDVNKQRTNRLAFNWQLMKKYNWKLFHEISIRHDEYIFLSTSEQNIQMPSIIKTYSATAINLHYSGKPDHTSLLQMRFRIEPAVNLKNYGYGLSSTTEVRYIKYLDATISLHVRAGAGNSFGTNPVFFFLGGTSSDLLSNFESRGFSDYKTNSYYQPVYGIRGFNANYRNGNSYALLNTELHWTLFKGIFRRPVVSEIFEYMDMVVFNDIATSMYGKSMFDEANVLNTTHIQSSGGSLDLEVHNVRNPTIASFGMGIHTRIYSYIIRTDLAYGYEGTSFKSPIWHISLGYGF